MTRTPPDVPEPARPQRTLRMPPDSGTTSPAVGCPTFDMSSVTRPSRCASWSAPVISCTSCTRPARAALCQRHFSALGWDCDVVAPSSIPRPSGERIRTDRRDAMKLVRLPPPPPSVPWCAPGPGDEAMRDMVRAREGSVREQRNARHRLKALLLRNGIAYTGKTAVDWRSPALACHGEDGACRGRSASRSTCTRSPSRRSHRALDQVLVLCAEQSVMKTAARVAFRCCAACAGVHPELRGAPSQATRAAVFEPSARLRTGR